MVSALACTGHDRVVYLCSIKRGEPRPGRAGWPPPIPDIPVPHFGLHENHRHPPRQLMPASVAQLDRALVFETRCRRFKSARTRYNYSYLALSQITIDVGGTWGNCPNPYTTGGNLEKTSDLRRSWGIFWKKDTRPNAILEVKNGREDELSQVSDLYFVHGTPPFSNT